MEANAPKPARSSRGGLLRIVLIIAAVGGGIWLWDGVIEDRVIPKRFGVVEEGAIYRSGQLHPALIERTLTKHGIGWIVNLNSDTPGNPEHEAEIATAKRLGIQRDVFSMKGDGTGDPRRVVMAIQSIVDAREQGTPVLVHCAAGAQRTGGVIATYRLLVRGEEPKEVIEKMQRYGWDPEDDRIVVDFVDEHMADFALMLHEQGVIDQVPDPLPKLGEGLQPG